MQRAIYSLTALVLTIGILAPMLRAETARMERFVQQQAAEVCPKLWADPQLAQANAGMEQRICGQI